MMRSQRSALAAAAVLALAAAAAGFAAHGGARAASASGPGTRRAEGAAVHRPPSFWPSPAMDACGQGFFTSATWAHLRSSHGTISCLRFAGRRQWVVIGDGMSPTAFPARPSAEGPLVAAETCARRDAACLDDGGPHAWIRFRAYSLPRAASWPLELEATFGGRLVCMTGGADPLLLDLRDGRWYRCTTTVVDEILTGSGRPTPLSVRLHPARPAAPTIGGVVTAYLAAADAGLDPSAPSHPPISRWFDPSSPDFATVSRFLRARADVVRAWAGRRVTVVLVTSQVQIASESVDGTSAVVDAADSIAFTYAYDSGPGQGVPNVSGFGNGHRLTLRREDGGWAVTSDAWDDGIMGPSPGDSP